jgi:hypothetical protein
MAYSTPVDIKELRDQAAVVSMVWKDHEGKLEKGDQGLETLTIEFHKSNIIVRAIQPNLLLVLVGIPPPTRAEDFWKMTAELRGDPRYPSAELPEPDESSSSQPTESEAASGSAPTPGEGSTGEQKSTSTAGPLAEKEKDLKLGLLHIQRKRLDGLTLYIRSEFDARGFVMPDDQGLT